MTKKQIIKEIESDLDITGAMVCIEHLGLGVREYPYIVYGIKRSYGATFFTSGPEVGGRDSLICLAKWDKFSKNDIMEIYKRMKTTELKIYSMKTNGGYTFYKIWP